MHFSSENSQKQRWSRISPILWKSRIINLDRIDTSNLYISIVNNFCYGINCVNIKRDTIYRAKCLSIVTFKHLPIRLFRKNAGEKVQNCLFRKWSWTELMWISLCKFHNETLRGFPENGRFLKIFESIYLENFTNLFQSFT